MDRAALSAPADTDPGAQMKKLCGLTPAQ